VTTTLPQPDRRAALKEKHRAAILGAARDLVHEQGGPRFSVDDLASKADVARRTIFNHFASLDEVLLTLCGDVLDGLVDDFVADVAAKPVGEGTQASMFEEMAQSLRSFDLPSAIVDIVLILGTPSPDDPRGQALTNETFARAADRLVAEVERRNSTLDPLDARLLVGSLMSGLNIVAKQWVHEVGPRLDEESRAEWQRLLTRMLSTVRSGYSPSS
jgi:TetR/AcrR family transcriptional regulator, regulator of autoinduction and epiphytic fitness